MTVTTTWTILLSYRRPPLTANQRLHWSHRARATATIRDMIGWHVRAQRIPTLDRPTVTLVYTPPDRRRRDVDNLVPTSKACVDALRAAGVLADDDPAHVDHRMPVITAPSRPPSLRLVIEAAS
jgi:crossover junction endodeoxyribonuclease RusA